MRNCCRATSKTKKCSRKSDKKTFTFPRRFSKKECLTKKIRGFTMRSSCAPFRGCKSQQGGRMSPRHIDNKSVHDNDDIAMEDSDDLAGLNLDDAFLYSDNSMLSDLDGTDIPSASIDGEIRDSTSERDIDLSMSSDLSWPSTPRGYHDMYGEDRLPMFPDDSPSPIHSPPGSPGRSRGGKTIKIRRKLTRRMRTPHTRKRKRNRNHSHRRNKRRASRRTRKR